MHKNCNTCRHWELIPKAKGPQAAPAPVKGMCRRNPPAGFPMMIPPKIAGQEPQMAVNTVWPITDENDRCGEHDHAAAS